MCKWQSKWKSSDTAKMVSKLTIIIQNVVRDATELKKQQHEIIHSYLSVRVDEVGESKRYQRTQSTQIENYNVATHGFEPDSCK